VPRGVGSVIAACVPEAHDQAPVAAD